MACVKYRLLRSNNGQATAANKQLRSAAFALSIVAHPMRLRILLRLSRGEVGVGQLNEELHLNVHTVSNYVTQLRRGGLVRTGHDGAHASYGLTEVGSKVARFVEDAFGVRDREIITVGVNMAGVVAYDMNGEFTFLNLKKATVYRLAEKGLSGTYHRDSGVPGGDFLFDEIVKTVEKVPRWFLSGNASPARWGGRTVLKPRRNGRDYLEVTPQCAASCFITFKKRLPSELAAVRAMPEQTDNK
ncbi:MAG: helix-turn-helix domain-containing protein [Isosphaeraceae bacterium]